MVKPCVNTGKSKRSTGFCHVDVWTLLAQQVHFMRAFFGQEAR